MVSLINCRGVKGRLEAASGGSLVEFTLISPLLLLILFGMLDLGRWVFLGIEVTSAAHAGAQYGSLSLTNAHNTSAIRTAAQNDAPDFGANLTVTPSTSECWCPSAPGSLVTCGTYPTNPCTNGTQIVLLEVYTQGTYNPWISYPPFTTAITLRGYAAMPTGQY
jgi:Flp pilus assembly protein TadG